jgi:hypothetical protein
MIILFVKDDQKYESLEHSFNLSAVIYTLKTQVENDDHEAQKKKITTKFLRIRE